VLGVIIQLEGVENALIMPIKQPDKLKLDYRGFKIKYFQKFWAEKGCFSYILENEVEFDPILPFSHFISGPN